MKRAWAAIVLAISTQLLLPQVTLAAECSWKSVVPSCDPKSLATLGLDLRKSKEETDGIVFNWVLAGKRDRRDLIKTLDSRSSPLDTRTLKLAEAVRQRAINAITQSRDEKDWNNEENAFAVRLRTVEFELLPSQHPFCTIQTQPGRPNAQYVKLQHAIWICPSLTHLNSDAIDYQLSHELGHVVSPCSMSQKLYDVTPRTTESETCFQKKMGGKGMKVNVDKILTRPHLVQFEQRFHEMEECGLINETPKSFAQNPISQRNYLQCSTNRFEKSYNTWASLEFFNAAEPPSPLSDSKKMEFQEFKNDNPNQCFSKSDEAYADGFAGLLLHWKASNDKVSRNSVQNHLSQLALMACRVSNGSGSPIDDPILYPSADERLSLLMSGPNTSRLLDCEVRSDSLCKVSFESASGGTEIKASRP